MKKISIILVLALLLTIGGVYASWGYAQGAIGNAIDSMDVGEGKNIFITEAINTNSAGTISIDATATQIKIDDPDNDHIAELEYTGDIVITFTPSSGADADIVANGIVLKVTVACTTTEWVYGGNQIFAVAPSFDLTLEDAEMVGGTQTYTITPDVWQQWIVFNGGEDLHLVTMQEYSKFHDALHKGMISITVSDASTLS